MDDAKQNPDSSVPVPVEGDAEWERKEGVKCVVCPHCCFTFAAIHTYADGTNSCPDCGFPDARVGYDALIAERDELKTLVADFAEEIALCLDCPNAGYVTFQVRSASDSRQAECEFCRTEPLSLFSLQARARALTATAKGVE